MQEYSIYTAIGKIRVRTGMYTWDRNLRSIGSYIYGYTQAMDDAGVKNVTYPKFAGFRAWIKVKFDFVSDAPGWENMILALAIGCEPKSRLPWERMKNATEEQHLESVKLFFSLIEEYKNETSDIKGG